MNYIMIFMLSLTQSQMPAILSSLLFQPLSTRKQTPSQPVLTGVPCIYNGAQGSEKLAMSILEMAK